MTDRKPKIIGPVDQRGQAIHRSMGLPVLINDTYVGGDSVWCILADFTADKYITRVFTSLSVENRATGSDLILAAVDDLMDTPREFLQIGTQQFFTLDDLQFGPGIIDDTEEKRLKYILARLDVAQGTQATGSIDYSVSLQPSNEETIEINGLVYEFSSDESKETSSDYLVEIGANADASWTNFINELNSTQRFVVGSINTTTDLITLTAIPGGTSGNAITIADGSTGAVFSGANLAGGSGGVLPIVHLW